MASHEDASHGTVLHRTEHRDSLLQLQVLSHLLNNHTLWSVPTHNKINVRVTLTNFRYNGGEKVAALAIDEPADDDNVDAVCRSLRGVWGEDTRVDSVGDD